MKNTFGGNLVKKALISLYLLFTASNAHSGELKDVADVNSSISKLANNSMEFVYVPGGCFRMGSTTASSDAKPVHERCVSGFYIAKYEVTQGQWRSVMGNNPSRFKNCGDDCPVEQVSWTDAGEFIRRLNSLTGREHRLPTEAEWEYACTGGGKVQDYCGVDNINSIAWHEGNSGGNTHPVGHKQPNGLGIYDMSGNVWEWVEGWKESYSESQQRSALNSNSSTRARRGGSWQYGNSQLRAAWRSSGYPDDVAPDIGFRLAVSLSAP